MKPTYIVNKMQPRLNDKVVMIKNSATDEIIAVQAVQKSGM